MMTSNISTTTAERFWAAHLYAIERDGVSVTGYARSHSLFAPSLYAWRSRLTRRRPKRGREPSPRFAELVPAPDVPTLPAATAVALSMILGAVRAELDALCPIPAGSPL